jgi:1-acyl-sn-glycerol-3-phosphate acyltransferase
VDSDSNPASIDSFQGPLSQESSFKIACPAHVRPVTADQYKEMQRVLASAVRHARVPAGNVLLRPLAASYSIPKIQPFTRFFATSNSGKGKKVVVNKAPPSVTSQLIKKLNDEVIYEIKNYESPPSIEHGPPKGWEKVNFFCSAIHAFQN